MTILADQIPIDAKAEFLSLSCRLSPENISCDGELTRTQINKRRTEIRREWRALEQKFGVRVSEDDAWRWSDEIQAWEDKKRRDAIDATEKHPLVEVTNPGVWRKTGPNGSRLYYIWGPPRGMSRYEAFSDWHWRLNKTENIGSYDTLAAAVEAAEAFIASITPEKVRAALPLYSEQNMKSLLDTLPHAGRP